MTNFEEVIKKYLGYKVKDRITGFEGIVTSVTFDLYGCTQAIITPIIGKYNSDGSWYDVSRLDILSRDVIMISPHLNDKINVLDNGPEVKPMFSKLPIK